MWWLILLLPFLAFSQQDKEKVRFWCESNWAECKRVESEIIDLKQRYLTKEKDCVERADSFQQARECKKAVKEQMKKELYNLKWQLMKKAVE
jgi:hypothetical protein